jgi:hypothetical protein
MFGSPKRVLARAEKFLLEIEDLNEKFQQSKPYEVTIKNGVHSATMKDPPEDMQVVANDFFTNARSVLDQAVFAASATMQPGVKPEKTKFPFGSDEQNVRKILKESACRDIPAALHEVMLSFKPYRGGDETLVRLNDLRNQNNHRYLSCTALMATDNFQILGGRQVSVRNSWDEKTKTLTFLYCSPDAMVHYTLWPIITFGQTGKPYIEHAIPSMRGFYTRVSQVLDALEQASAKPT